MSPEYQVTVEDVLFLVRVWADSIEDSEAHGTDAPNGLTLPLKADMWNRSAIDLAQNMLIWVDHVLPLSFNPSEEAKQIIYLSG